MVTTCPRRKVLLLLAAAIVCLSCQFKLTLADGEQHVEVEVNANEKVVETAEAVKSVNKDDGAASLENEGVAQGLATNQESHKSESENKGEIGSKDNEAGDPMAANDDPYEFDYKAFDPDSEYNPENYYVQDGEDYEDEDVEEGFHMDDFTPDHVYSFPVESGKEECFFTDVESTPLLLRGAYFVSGGGGLDIDMKVSKVQERQSQDHAAKEDILRQYSGKSESVFAIEATSKGQYSFCFNNPGSRYGEKVVTFALNVGKRKIHKLHVKGDHLVRLANTVHESRRTLHELEGEAHFLQERTRRHMLIQDSTEFRVAWYTVFESLFMFAITIGQIVYVQRLINQRAWV